MTNVVTFNNRWASFREKLGILRIKRCQPSLYVPICRKLMLRQNERCFGDGQLEGDSMQWCLCSWCQSQQSFIVFNVGCQKGTFCIHDSTKRLRSLASMLSKWTHLEFVKKFTRPNLRAKEFYTLKTRKSRLFLPAINSKNASLSVIWPSFG